MIDTKKEKVIEYEPSPCTSKDKKFFVVISFFIITWLIVIAGGVLIKEQFDFLEHKSDLMNSEFSKTKKNISHLNTSVFDLESRTNDISYKLKTSLKTTSRIDNIENIVNALQSEFPSRNTANDASEHDKKAINDAILRIEKLEKQPLDNDKKTNDIVPLIFAMLNLRDRILQSKSYKIDLSIAKELSKQDVVISKNIQSLEKLLKEGVVSEDGLKDEFNTLVKKIIVSSQQVDDKNLWGRVVNKLSSRFTIRKISNNTDDNSIDSIIWRAETALKNNQVEKAIDEMNKLPKSSKKLAEKWLENGKRLLESESIFSKIYEHIIDASSKNKSDASK